MSIEGSEDRGGCVYRAGQRRGSVWGEGVYRGVRGWRRG